MFHYLQELIAEGEAYVVLLPIYVLLLGGERAWYFFKWRNQWDDRDAAANVFITSLFLLGDLLLGAILPVALIAIIHQFAGLFTLGMGVWSWLFAFLLYDLIWYLDHRIAHRVAFFWAFHHVHHSSEQYNTTVASRGFVLDNFLITRPLFYLLPVLGFTPLHFIVVRIVTNIWGIAQHTRVIDRLPVLDQLLATPSNHRVHHGSNEKYLDRNYGEVLILWDHFFGTYQREEEEPTYGVTEPINTYNPVKIQLAGLSWLRAKLKTAPDWNTKLRMLYKPPGWRPEGTEHKPSTEQVQRAA